VELRDINLPHPRSEKLWTRFTVPDVSDAVVTLKTPKLDGTTLTFDITVLEGNLTGASGLAAPFIDRFGGGGGIGGGSFGGGGRFGGDFAGGDLRGGLRGNDVHVGDTNINRVGGSYWQAPVYHGAWAGVVPATR